jgi:hypothetical protein
VTKIASIQYVVSATDAASGVFARIAASADGLDKQLSDLSKRVADPSVTLDDAKFTVGMVNAAKRLDRLSAMVADPKIEIDGGKAQLEILRISAMLDRLDAKRVSVDVGIHRRTAGGFLRGLVSSSALSAFLSGGAGAAGTGGAAAAAAGGSPFLDFLGSPAGIGAGAAGAPFAAALADALAGFGLGTGVAGIGAIGAYKASPGSFAPGLSMITTTLNNVFKSIAPTLGMMTASLGRFVQLEQGPLAKLFSASLPFASAWVRILATAAKQILPVLTQVLNQMVQSGALKEMTQGFASLTQGVANAIRYIGPGFKAGGEIFRAVSIAMGGLLAGLGATFGTLGNTAGHIMTFIHDRWDWLRHATANVFDGMRHDLAAAWNAIYSDTIGNVIRLDRGIIGWFGRLPGQLVHALWGLGHSLAAFMRSAFTEMWAAMKNIGGTILSWATSWASNLWHGFLHFFHIGSPSGLFYDIGKNLMLGLFHGIKDHTGIVAGAAGGAAGAAGGSVAALAQRMAAQWGWAGQWGAINAVAMRESGWSMTARNPSSGAYGIAQFINGPGEYYQYGGSPGTAAGQITGFYNYMRQRYGSPAAAWAHELNFGWYDRGGWLPPGLSLALNQTGAPERVGGGGVINNYVTITAPPGTSPAELGRRVAEVLAEYKKRGGMIYKPGGF